MPPTCWSPASRTIEKSPRAPDMLLKLGIALAGAQQQDAACKTFADVEAISEAAARRSCNGWEMRKGKRSARPESLDLDSLVRAGGRREETRARGERRAGLAGADAARRTSGRRRRAGRGWWSTRSIMGCGPRRRTRSRWCCAKRQCWNIPARGLRWEGDKPETGVQAAARKARYGCWRRRWREDGAELLLTAHHLGDQAETVLMRLAHGSGIEGLRGMDRFTIVEGCSDFPAAAFGRARDARADRRLCGADAGARSDQWRPAL